MIIKHYCNSFISVREKDFSLVCDPWVGQINNQAWLSFPIYQRGISLLKKIKPNYIYISHLHSDHFDADLLFKYFKFNNKTKIIINKFSDQRLKKKIQEIGCNRIIEIESWNKHNLTKSHSVTIVPQMTTNTSGIETQVNYDLDTSILVKSELSNKVFFNNVDNPLSYNDIKIVNNYSKKVLKSKINVVCFPIGAASEYPQCFMNINREREKKRIIKKSLTSVEKKLDLLKPDIFFQAGGTYLMCGKFSTLDKYIAQPRILDAKKYLSKYCVVKNIEGGGEISLNNGKWIAKECDKLNSPKFRKKILQFSKRLKYSYYKNIENDYINQKALRENFEKASYNYFKKLIKLNIKTSWNVNFFLYKNLTLINSKISKSKSKLIDCLNLKFKSKVIKNKLTNLNLHLDCQLFNMLLRRKTSWNTSLSGSCILYERYPNKFDPNIPFSLNYLVV
jgi:L-ascorbate metabolism protein UlaG (beta-lactamase superfamily)